MNQRNSFFGRILLSATLILTVMVNFFIGVPPAYAKTNPVIVTSFTAPGAQVSALAWGDGSLWLADENDTIYRLAVDGTVESSFTSPHFVSDMGWYDNSLWIHDGNSVYELDSAGNVVSTLDVGYWSGSGMEWADGYLYVGDYNSSDVYKHSSTGMHILSWPTTFFGHPEDMAYDGKGLWIADSCEGGNGLWHYSLQGELQDTIDLDAVEGCSYTTERAITWDGQYLWYAGNFTVYRLDITGPFVDQGFSMTGVTQSDSAWGDYDGDSDLDVIVTGLDGTVPLTEIYRNDGGNVFTDINTTIVDVYDGSVDWGDFDRDGDLDVLLTGCAAASCGARTARVYRNQGSGSFTNVSTAGLPGVSGGEADWGDYDSDGDLDILLLGHNGSTGVTGIYRNNGNSTFTELLVDMLHWIGPPMVSFELSDGSVAWGDYDNDGDLDALLTGCYTATCAATSLDIYDNNGNDTFTLAFNGEGAGARSSSIEWGDYDNDGDLDILQTGSMGWAAYEVCHTTIWQSDATETGIEFTDISALITGACQGSIAWGDYDNDGDLDVVLAGDSEPSGYNTLTTKVYRNEGAGDFTDIGASLKDIYMGSVAWGDYDNDSDLDILLTGGDFAKIYQNGNTATNTPPSAPSGLSTVVNGTAVEFAWDPTTDDHTPASGLSYNVRVGTTPSGAETISPMAASSGYRFVPRLGNLNQGVTAALSNLAPGTYYWSVQAIDSAWSGSAFAAENTFTVYGDPPAAFNKSAPTDGTLNQSTSPTVSWAASTGATSYEYCYDTTNDDACSAWTDNGTATSVALSGLDNSTTYYWHVRAINAGGITYSNGSETVFWSFTTIMGAPGTFSKSTPTDGATDQPTSLTLNWEASTNAASYQYCYDTSNDNACSNWTGNGTSTSKALSGLSPNTTYYWHVRASNAGGTTYSNSSETAFWSFTTGVNPPGSFNKSAPVNGATSQATNPILRWGPSVGAISYEYCYDTTNDNACAAWVDNGTSTSVALSGLNFSTTYYWQVRAINSGGITYSNGSAAVFWKFTTQAPVIPGIPTLLLPVNGSLVTSVRPTLDWKDAKPQADHYQLQVSTNSTFTTIILDELDIPVSIFTPTSDLVAGKLYYWRVRAFNVMDQPSAWSAKWTFKTPLSQPTLVSPTEGESLPVDRPTFSWSDVPGATGYTLQGSAASNFSTLLVNVTVTQSQYTATKDLPQNKTLFWRVRAKSSAVTGPWSLKGTFKTGNPPTVPVLVAPTNGALLKDYTPEFNWNNASLPAGTTFKYYEIQWDEDKLFTSPVTNTTTLNDRTDSDFTPLADLASNTKYYWRVRSVNTVEAVDHTSGWSSVWSFRTILPAPTGLTVTPNGSQPSFSWDAATGPSVISGYTIQISTSSTFSTLLVNSTTIDPTYSMHKNLPSGKIIYWRVRVNGANGPSAWSKTQFTIP